MKTTADDSRGAIASRFPLTLVAIAILVASAEQAWPDPPRQAAPVVKVARVPAADSAKLGLVSEQPKDGHFVKTAEGFMIPYTATIPGTDVEFEMVPIPGGKFKMGSPDGEKGHKPVEGPQFEVDVEPCWMGKFEITWAEYREFMKLTDVFKSFEGVQPPPRAVTKDNQADAVTAPSNLYDPTFTFRNGQKPRLPAVTMSQYAAKQYTKWLSLLSGDFYRLPTEAEWEHAARADQKTAYFFGDDPAQLGKYAWYFENSTETTHEVGQKQPSPWGLYDIYGNASEWVLDQYLPDGYKKFGGRSTIWKDAIVWPTKLFPRVLRGGSWDADAADCRSASRRGSSDDEWRETDPNSPKSPWWFTEPEALGVGFRIIRPLKPAAEADRAKYWDSDLASITLDAKDRLDQGRGARGIVDPNLPDAVQKLDEQRKNAGRK
jgi:formylglycine-generating enzyme